jgi:hypothetical protein
MAGNRDACGWKAIVAAVGATGMSAPMARRALSPPTARQEVAGGARRQATPPDVVDGAASTCMAAAGSPQATLSTFVP